MVNACKEHAYMWLWVGKVRSIGSDMKMRHWKWGEKMKTKNEYVDPRNIVDDLSLIFRAHNLSDLVV